MISTSLPTVMTERLILRETKTSDYKDMYEYASLPNVGPVAGWKPHANLRETKAILQLFEDKKKFGQLGTYAIVLRESQKMIGTVELHSYIALFKAELGYTVSPYYWGRGIAVEASKEVIKVGFEYFGLRRIECTTFVDNYQSQRVCEKLGLTYEGIRKNGYQLYDGTIHDIQCYSIIDEEYFSEEYQNKILRR